MTQTLLYGAFLYIPKDKMAYIPAVLQLMMLLIVVALVFRWFIKKSQKDALAAKELEQRLVNERQSNIKK